MNINLDDLSRIVVYLLMKIKENHGEVVTLNEDFYWNINNEELYNPYSEPKKLTLGLLSDEIKEITRLFDNHDEIVLYDLKRISEILKALSYDNLSIG